MLYRRGEWHSFSFGNELFEGKIKGVGNSGKLMVELRKGDSKEFDLKEIEFIV